MDLGEWRKRTKDLPDDTVLVFFDEEQWDFWEAVVNTVLPAVLGHPPAILIDGGMPIGMDYDLLLRKDVSIGYDPDQKDDG